jgi:hypothetical protein
MVEKDNIKTNAEQGLYKKFNVTRVDGKYPDRRYFVLDIDHDPHALDALWGYAESCKYTHPELADDLFQIVESKIG